MHTCRVPPFLNVDSGGGGDKAGTKIDSAAALRGCQRVLRDESGTRTSTQHSSRSNSNSNTCTALA